MTDDFWEWLPKAYGDVGDEPVFTKYNMEVAFAAGAEAEAKRMWVGLTDQEIDDLWNQHEPRFDYYSFSCDIEYKLKEKNMKQCKCEHWQQCPTCMPHRFDEEGNLKPPEPTPLQSAKAEVESLKQRLFEMQKAAIDLVKQPFLAQEDLALRWGISGATLERDRSLKQGVRYLKIGGLIRYRLQDVLDYENECTVETAARKQK